MAIIMTKKITRFIGSVKDAKFGTAFIGIGLAPGCGTQFFTKLVGYQKACEYILTSKTFNAEESAGAFRAKSAYLPLPCITASHQQGRTRGYRRAARPDMRQKRTSWGRLSLTIVRVLPVSDPRNRLSALES